MVPVCNGRAKMTNKPHHSLENNATFRRISPVSNSRTKLANSLSYLLETNGNIRMTVPVHNGRAKWQTNLVVHLNIMNYLNNSSCMQQQSQSDKLTPLLYAK